MQATKNFLKALSGITGTGSFHSSGTAPFSFPGLHVEGLGEIAFPLPGAEAKALMEQTSVRQKWVVETLHMGSVPYVSRLAKLMGERIAEGDRTMRTLKNKIVKILS